MTKSHLKQTNNQSQDCVFLKISMVFYYKVHESVYHDNFIDSLATSIGALWPTLPQKLNNQLSLSLKGILL